MDIAEVKGMTNSLRLNFFWSFLQALSAEFDLTLAEAAEIYFCNSGHLEAARYWIQTGRTLPGEVTE